MNAELAHRSWRDSGSGALVVPIGATEQHGPHLPLGTDTIVAEHVARAIVERAEREGIALVLAPTLPYGASGEHEDFPGTLSIGTDALVHLLLELARSAARWIDRVVVINGHGGNVDALERASAALRGEGVDFAWLPCGAATAGDAAETDLHAGHTETSLMLALHADLVDLEAAEPGITAPFGDLISELRRSGVRAVSPNGVLGDPRGATAEAGRDTFLRMCAEVWEGIVRWHPCERGRLSV